MAPRPGSPPSNGSDTGARYDGLASWYDAIRHASPLRLVRVEEPRDDPVPAVLALLAERPRPSGAYPAVSRLAASRASGIVG
jgi:hypothetical protein